MKVFITGLAGMLGCNIAYKLRKEYIISGVDLIKVNMENVDSYEFDALDGVLIYCLWEMKRHRL